MIREFVALATSNEFDALKGEGLVPKDGVYFRIDPKSWEVQEYEVYSKKKNEGLSDFLSTSAQVIDNSWMVSTNKCLDLPSRGIHSASPFCIAFKRDSWVGGAKFAKDGDNNLLCLERIQDYFSKTKGFSDKEDHALIDAFQTFFLEKASLVLDSKAEVLNEIGDAGYITFYLDLPLEKYQEVHGRHLKDKLFNTPPKGKPEEDGTVFGTSDFFNGFNVKKQFLTHNSATFDVSQVISDREAKGLYDFKKVLDRKILPNPLPIFIDREELTGRAIRIDRGREDKKLGYRRIVRELLEEHRQNLGNYYLLFYQQGEIKDFDFVSKFDYELKENGQVWVVENHLPLKDSPDKTQIKNIFDFEKWVLFAMFNNKLVVLKDNELVSNRYFDELKAEYCGSAHNYQQMLKYRKACYDFVYKSRRSAINGLMFDDILISGMMDDLRNHELDDGNTSAQIKRKLNLYFSLHHIFHKTNQSMASTLPQMRSAMRELLNEEERVLANDKEFGYTAGQVIYYLLAQSKTSKKTHALLEPFIQKNDGAKFKEALVSTFFKYKHEPYLNSKRFNALMAELMGYAPEKSIKEIWPEILAGYFDKNLLFENSNADKPELELSEN